MFLDVVFFHKRLQASLYHNILLCIAFVINSVQSHEKGSCHGNQILHDIIKLLHS
jgi:hypothetical protein